MFEEVLALLAPVAVEHVNGKPLEIEIDSIAKQQHQSHRHEDYDCEAARVAKNLDDLLLGDGQQAIKIHGLASAAASRIVVTETKTSSNVGRIFSMLLTAMPCSLRNDWICGMAAVASRTTRCSALPKTAASIIAGADCKASTAGPRGSHATRSNSPFIESRLSSEGVPRATILPRKIRASRLQYSASSM